MNCCLSAAARPCLLSIDARCRENDDEGRIVLSSGDTISVRIELVASEQFTGLPIAVSWQVFDHATDEALTEATAIEPSLDMAFMVSGLVNETTVKRHRQAVQVVVDFDDGEQRTIAFDVWVERRRFQGAAVADDLLPFFVGVGGLSIGGAL